MLAAAAVRSFRPYGVTLPAIAAVGLAVGLLSWSVDHTTYDTWGGIMVGFVLALVSVPLVARAARREEDPRVARLLPWALALKLVSSLVRLAVAFGVYDGVADANTYHRAGEALAPLYRDGDFSAQVGPVIGSGFLKVITGLLYVVTGPTRVGGFLVFSWVSFWGLYLFYRAFCIACPEGDRWRYARLVLLLPSLLFWPSSIGKEAWMTLTLGLAAYGAARFIVGRRWGFLALAAGLAGTLFVRPHVSAILMASMVGAYLLRRKPGGDSLLAPVVKLLGIAGLCLLLVLAVGQTKELLGVRDQFNVEAVTQALERARSQTSLANSYFGTAESTNLSPARFPEALVSVLFRPLPWEANNSLALVASLEGLLMLALFVVSWRRLAGAVRSMLRTPYVMLCLVYTALFVYGFSSFANFGILTRQRVQVLPFAVVILALPPFHRGEEGWRSLLVDEAVGPDGAPAEGQLVDA